MDRKRQLPSLHAARVRAGGAMAEGVEVDVLEARLDFGRNVLRVDLKPSIDQRKEKTQSKQCYYTTYM